MFSCQEKQHLKLQKTAVTQDEIFKLFKVFQCFPRKTFSFSFSYNSRTEVQSAQRLNCNTKTSWTDLFPSLDGTNSGECSGVGWSTSAESDCRDRSCWQTRFTEMFPHREWNQPLITAIHHRSQTDPPPPHTSSPTLSPSSSVVSSPPSSPSLHSALFVSFLKKQQQKKHPLLSFSSVLPLFYLWLDDCFHRLRAWAGPNPRAGEMKLPWETSDAGKFEEFSSNWNILSLICWNILNPTDRVHVVMTHSCKLVHFESKKTLGWM